MTNDLETRVAALEDTVKRIVDQFYRDGIWKRPVEKIEYPQATASVSDVVESRQMGKVFMKHRYVCACGEVVVGNVNVPTSMPNPFTLMLSCKQGHQTEVTFTVPKES